MKCPECQFENREDAKFCNECGHKFDVTCPECKSSNRVSSKFCDECGHKLTAKPVPHAKELSFDEKLTKIQKYLPKGLTEKILAQRDRIEGERKQVTVMFCDMKNFTALSEKLGAEEAYAMMDQVYEILIHKVHDYEGTVNQMTGDGIMALFGAPIAIEDAPQRAIRSAYAIHREMSRFNDKIRLTIGAISPIRMRIGIHTGPVVVGTLGNDLRVEFKAVGDTVNLASRVEGLAEPGATLITEDTLKLTEGIFEFEALGEKYVKGKQAPVKVYRVIAPSTRQTRFDVNAERNLTPLVGRRRELELLLDGFERSRNGHGQAFSVIADAGVGKSRLLYEFRKAVANEDVTFLEGKCLSYSRGTAYQAVIDVLQSNFYISERDKDAEIKQKVSEGLKVLGADEGSTFPYLLELLSVKDSGIDQITLSSEMKKDRILEALRRIVLKGSQIRPLIMAIENLHWIDKSSEECFKDLLNHISGARVFLIFTYRPEYVHTWGGRSYLNQVNLNRLSNRESLVMMGHLLSAKDIDTGLQQLILEKTEGVPFFIEEFVKSLKDLNIIEKENNRYYLTRDIGDMSIPSTIQDVVMARVDSLPEDAKRVLQFGSTIGREFNYKLIKQIYESSEQKLLSSMSILKDSELLYERGIYPQSTYVFKHALTQDTIYQSLLKSNRQKYHRRITQVLEKCFPEMTSVHPEVLGRHFTEAGMIEQAIPYWQKAGEIAIRRSANIEAIGHLKNGLELFKTLPGEPTPERIELELRLQVALGNALIATRGYADPEVGKTFNRASELCLQEDKSPQLFQVLCGLARFHMVRTELQKTRDLGEQLLSWAKRHQDEVLFLSAHQLIGTALWAMGNFASAQEQFEQGIAYYEPQQHRSYISLTDEDQGVICLSYTAWNSWLLGYPDRSVNISHKALTLARNLSHPLSTVFALSYAAILYQCRQEPGEARKHAEAALTLATEQGFLFWIAAAETFLGWALSAQGQREEGIALIRRGLAAWQATGGKFGLTRFYVVLAEVCGKTENVEEGLNVIADALALAQTNEECFWEAELYRVKGELLLMQGEDEAEAENSFKQGIETARHQHAKSLELRSTLSLSRLWHAQGKREDAKRVLTEIYNWFEEGFDSADLKEARNLLDVIS
ncbi:MAG: adenylate/guanylate cyclase domain-containing protein [Nitrospinales bacterium]